MDLIVRPATAQDCAAIRAYLAELRVEAPDTLRRRGPPVDGEIEQWLSAKLALSRSFVLIAVLDDAVVGLLDLDAGQRDDNRHAARLGMSVSQRQRGRGVGRLLLQRAIAQTKSWPGFCRIELDCVSWNLAGISLYKSLGFEVEAIRRKGVNLRGNPEDDLLMALVW